MVWIYNYKQLPIQYLFHHVVENVHHACHLTVSFISCMNCSAFDLVIIVPLSSISATKLSRANNDDAFVRLPWEHATKPTT